MKRNICLILTLMLLLSCIVMGAAAEESPVITDMENLLTSDEIVSLTDSAHRLEEEYGIDIMIVTTSSFQGYSAQNYADAYYDQNGGGDDGVLFLLSMTQREWYISTTGSCIYALTDYSIQQLGEDAAYWFADGYCYDGFEAFLDGLPTYLDAYESGSPIDGYADYSGSYYHGDQDEVVYYDDSAPNLLVSLGAGLIAAAIGIFAMKSSLNTKRPQHGASVYLKAGSWHLKGHQDMFLYSNVSKQRRQQNTGSGGSSVHRSSGGHSHGGGGGRF